MIEADNEKARRAARREFNENVREMVAFVKKRDKRVLAHALEEAARKAEAAALEAERCDRAEAWGWQWTIGLRWYNLLSDILSPDIDQDVLSEGMIRSFVLENVEIATSVIRCQQLIRVRFPASASPRACSPMVRIVAFHTLFFAFSPRHRLMRQLLTT